MTDSNKRGGQDGKDGAEQSASYAPETSKMSAIVPSTKQAKHWAKQYRTEIAASSSSILSTFVAVG